MAPSQTASNILPVQHTAYSYTTHGFVPPPAEPVSVLDVVLSLLDVLPSLDEESGGVTTVVVFFSTRVVELLLAGGFTTTVDGAAGSGLEGAAGLFTIVVLSEAPGATTTGVSPGPPAK